jgi:hypothetical protein
MVKTVIDEFDWTIIQEAVHGGTCVPFLGAGVNADCPRLGYTGLPLGGDVALRLIEKLLNSDVEKEDDLASVQIVHDKLKKTEWHQDLARLRFKDLPRVALHVQVKSKRRRVHLINWLRQILAEDKHEPSKPLHTLATLPFRLIVTTNYDCLMERALDKRAEESHRSHPYLPVVQPIKGFSETEGTQWTLKLAQWMANQVKDPENYGPILYKIHGTLDGGATAAGSDGTVIVTEEDYIEFLTVIGKKIEGIPDQIRSLMASSTLLFLGYSLEDWDFRTIYKGLIEDPDQQPLCYAIQDKCSSFWVDFWASKGVAIYNMDVYDFVEQLSERCT